MLSNDCCCARIVALSQWRGPVSIAIGRLFARLLFAALALTAAALAWSLPASQPLTAFTLDRFDSRNGLPDNMVMALAQTPDGYMWFGTWEGLARFNGHEFTVFDRDSTPELERHAIRALAADRAGNLWIGTARGGLIRRDAAGQWQRWHRADGSLPFDDVMKIVIDDQQRVWATSETAGLARIDADGRVQHFGVEQGLSNGTVFDLTQRADGSMLVATFAGLDEIDTEGRGSEFGQKNGLPPGQVRAVASDAEGRLRVIAGGKSYSLDERVGFISAKEDAPTGVQSIYRDRAGALWFGSAERGLWREVGQRQERLSTDNGLAHNRVLAMLEDHEGNLWVGTSAGVQRIRHLPFATLGASIGLDNRYVRSLSEDVDGGLWIGTAGGLYRYGLPQQPLEATRVHGLPNESILTLSDDRKSGLLVGTYGGGMFAVRDGRALAVAGADVLAGAQVRAILPTGDQSLWVGSSIGLFYQSKSGWRKYATEQGLPRPYVMALARDQHGKLIVGTSAGFAVQVDDDHFMPFGEAQGFPARDVFAIAPRASDTLWFATDAGLVRWRDGEFKRFSEDQGLPFRSWFTLLDDGRGNVWLSSNRGIVKVAWAELEGAIDDSGRKLVITEFDESDGLTTRQANGGSLSSAIRRIDGSLWFSTAEGVARIDPNPAAQSVDQPPRVVIESLRVDGVALSPGELASAGSKRFEVRFAGIQFRSPERVM